MYISLVLSPGPTVSNGITRLGICNAPLRAGNGPPARCHLRRIRRDLRRASTSLPPASIISWTETQPTAESPLPPAQALQTAREQLLEIFRQQFQKASTERDAAATSRFFKLFPAIGWEEEGLQAYAAFVVDLVKVRAPASAKSMFYKVSSEMDC